MADAATTGAPVPGTEGNAGNQSGAAPAAKKETPAQAAARLKLDLGDGEREYDPEHVRGLAQRGKKAAQTLSLAEKRAQEAAKKEQEIEARIGRLKSKDAAEVRAALRELGVDVRGIANAEGQEALQEMELEKDPVRKELHQAKRLLAEKERAEAEAKAKQEEEALTKEAERHREELSELFLDVMKRGRLPKTSARAVFPRIASLYQAAGNNPVDPDLAAERVRTSLMEEHKALFTKEDGALDVDGLEEWLGEEGMLALQRRAVAKWKAKKGAGQQAAPAETREEAPKPNGAGRPGNFWKELERRLK